MKRPVAVLLCLLLPTLLAAEPPPRRAFAFTHVTVIDGSGTKPRPDQTVLITGDRITRVGKTGGVRVPDDAQVLDSRGKFLIPGLWDMHVHVGSSARSYLPLFIANGVTGIRIMSGSPEHHAWQKEIEEGAAVGPRMVIASAVLDGPTTYFDAHVRVADAEGAREAVRQVRRDGADFIKVHDLVPRAAYFAVTDEARKQGLPVAGHIPNSITPEEASDARQASVEHLTRLDDVSLTGDDRRQTALFTRFRKNRTWQCPTLVMTRNYVWLNDPFVTSDARVKYVRPGLREGWRAMSEAKMPAEEFEKRQQVYRRKQGMVRRMHRAGVAILAGTDLGNPYLVPGFSLVDELVILTECGLTPMEALQAATRSPARFLGRENDMGTVQKGKRADLVLLDRDPLADLRNLTTIHAVVADGRVYDRTTLDRMLADAAAAAAQGR